MIGSYVPAFAEEANEIEDCNVSTELDVSGLYLIDEQETVLEDGTVLVERLYCGSNPMLRGSSGAKGSDTFTKTNSLTFLNNQTFEYWVSGYFSWDADNNTATVTNRVYGHDPVPSNCKITNEDKDWGDNKGMNILWGRIYAYVKYSFTFTNWLGRETKASVYLDVNIDGVSS